MTKKQSRSIFDFRSYKDFLSEVSRGERGSRSRLAEAMNCHSAYVSQVLNGNAHLSLEQGEQVSRFLGLNKEEAHFFLLLVQYDRAGTAPLKSYFDVQIKEAVKKQLILKDRLVFKRSLSREDQAIFYSSWYFGAVHVLVSVAGCNTERGIAKYLNLPVAKVSEILNFLLSVGLIEKEEGKYQIGTSHIHLEHDSPMIAKHHANWRMRAIQAFDEVNVNDLHYSSVITCSAEDSIKIKAALVRAIEEVRAIVRPSTDEGAFVYCLDFFGLKSDRE